MELIENKYSGTGWKYLLVGNKDVVDLTADPRSKIKKEVWNAVWDSIAFLENTKPRIKSKGGVLTLASDVICVEFDSVKKLIVCNSDNNAIEAVLLLLLTHGSVLGVKELKTIFVKQASSTKLVTKRDVSSDAVLDALYNIVVEEMSLTNVIVDESFNPYKVDLEKQLDQWSLLHLIGDLSNEQKVRKERNDMWVSSKNIENDSIILELVESYHSGLVASMMDGTSSVGKTTRYRKIASLLCLPFYSQNFSLNVDEDTVIGKLVLDGQGGMMLIEGEFTKAFRCGGFYVAEELNRCRADVTVTLNMALSEGVLTLPNGETIQQHPAFRFGMAINQGYAGTKPLDMSFLRRMRRRYFISTLTEEEMKKIARNELPEQFSSDILDLMVKIAKEIELKYQKEGIPDTVVPVTAIVDWGLLYLQNGNDLLASAIPTIVNLTCLDREVNVEVLENIVRKYA